MSRTPGVDRQQAEFAVDELVLLALVGIEQDGAV